MMYRFIHALAAVSGLLTVTAWSSDEIQPADLIFRGGDVYTVDAARSWAQSVAIRGGEIVFVGSDRESGPFVGDNTRVVELDGKMMLPGFQDAHVHPVWAGVAYLGCGMFDLPTVEAYVDAAVACDKENPGDGWLVGDGWTMDPFAPSGIPHKSLLDVVLPDRPAAFLSADGHSIWVNSKALEVVGITKETPDPPGGIINKDPETGEPVGALQEQGGINLILAQAPKHTSQDLIDGLEYALVELNKLGITAFQDAIVKIEGSDPYVSLDTYAELDQRGALTARVVAALYWEYETITEYENGKDLIQEFIEARNKYTNGRIHATAVKIWLDGVIESHTAALLHDYADRPGFKSDITLPASELNLIARALDSLGFQIHYHAIGDYAVRASLDSVAYARAHNGIRDSRHHICHLQVVDPADLPRFRELNVIANFQPLWAYEDSYITDLTYPRLGPERSEYLYPIGGIHRSGAIVAFGSDWYVSSPDPLAGIETAVTRLGADGSTTNVFLPDQRINLSDAIAAYTINAAYTNFLDDRTGTIEVGKLADLIVLDKNLFEIEPAQISDTTVLLTLLDGEPVHGSLDDL